MTTDLSEGTYQDNFAEKLREAQAPPEVAPEPSEAPETLETASDASQAVQEAPDATEGTPEPLKTAEMAYQRAERLIEANLNRLRERFHRAAQKGDIDLSNHIEIVYENLPDCDREVIDTEIGELQQELSNVLLEQRPKVIEKWNIKKFTSRLMAS